MSSGAGLSRSRRAGAESGASLVEFALVVPLLTVFLFGIVQFGIAYDMKQSINSAAREGARSAAIPSNSFADVAAASRNAFQGISSAGEVTVEVTNAQTGYAAEQVGLASPTGDHATAPCEDFGGTPAEGTTVVVSATVDHKLTIPFIGAPEIELVGRGEFRCERAVS